MIFPISVSLEIFRAGSFHPSDALEQELMHQDFLVCRYSRVSRIFVTGNIHLPTNFGAFSVVFRKQHYVQLNLQFLNSAINRTSRRVTVEVLMAV